MFVKFKQNGKYRTDIGSKTKFWAKDVINKRNMRSILQTLDFFYHFPPLPTHFTITKGTSATAFLNIIPLLSCFS